MRMKEVSGYEFLETTQAGETAGKPTLLPVLQDTDIMPGQLLNSFAFLALIA